MKVAETMQSVTGCVCRLGAATKLIGSNFGALVWRCPVCDQAWPLATEGHRGAMARSVSRRINSSHHRQDLRRVDLLSK